MNVLSITIESDFTLCWSKCCGYYKYRYATSSPTRLARTKIITKKDRWLEASRCSKPRPTLALSTCIHHTAEFWALHPNHQAAAKGRGRPPAKAKGKKKASKYYDSEDDVVYRYVANMGLILLPAAKPAGL